MIIILIYFDYDFKREYNFTEKLLKRFLMQLLEQNILNISDITLQHIQKLKEDEKKDMTRIRNVTRTKTLKIYLKNIN